MINMMKIMKNGEMKMTKKTKQELLDEAWDEYFKKVKPLWDEYNKKLKEIEEKFKEVCEVCGR